MLRPLLLLCWAATIVSAGDLKTVILNGTSVSTNLANYNVAANSQSTLQHESNLENEHALNDSTSNTFAPTITLTKSTISSSNTTTTTTTSTTTPPPTTTKLTTTSTPVSTTVPTTLAPTTPRPPTFTKWIVKENNTACIIAQMVVQINVSYTNNNVTSHKVVDLPTNSSVTGKCGKTEQNLTLSWKLQNETTLNNFTIHFMKDETGKYYSIHHFEIFLVAKEFPNNKSNKTVTLVHMTPQFKTGLSNSYRCIKEQQLNLTLKGNNVTIGLMKVTNLQFQAFRSDNSTIFGLAKDCSFDTPDIVPIAVGCALAGLVIIVLIVYLFGRRRSQARGYLSIVDYLIGNLIVLCVLATKAVTHVKKKKI